MKVWRVCFGRIENKVAFDENTLIKPITVAWIQHWRFHRTGISNLIMICVNIK